jgi:Rrf2 family transcriptional regulator, iron-sulfur cluster assembly transcription factor
MRVTTKGRYALRAITNLILADSERPVPIKLIASEEDISPEFLEQIFFKLKKAGIINSVRGPGGGFTLDRDPADITVKEVFDAVGEGLEITPCTGEDDCERQDICLVHEVWKDASRHIVGYFEKLTLERVVEMCREKSLDSVISGN